MCGFLVSVDPRNAAGNQYTDFRGALTRALGLQVARGPDHDGATCRNTVWMGHRLLRILPCPQSVQPMLSMHGDMAIVFNGEIYNYKELRQELIDRGVPLRSNTDTEVILELYRLSGKDCVRRLNGMFSFAIHDYGRREIFLARDRFGQKPLYARRHGNGILFSSSLKSLLVPDFGPADINHNALHEYLWTLNCYDDQTLYKDITHVAPGSYWIVGEDGAIRAQGQFGAVRFGSVSRPVGAGEAAEAATALLHKAVHRQQAGLDAAGAYLSGGLDSSAIVASLARQGTSDIGTYSCSYQITEGETSDDERGFEELRHARRVAEHYGVPNQPVHISPDDYFFDLIDIVETLEEPKGNPCLPHYELAQCASRRHRVVFSGEGADELFGGYPWKLAASLAPSAAETEARFFRALVPAETGTMAELLRPRYADRSAPFAAFRASLALPGHERALDAVMSYDFRHFLTYLLLQADKISGRFGMEARYPFLDDDLVEFALRLPPALRFAPDGASKPVLREALRGILPDTILSRPKIGFVPPEGSWYRHSLFQLVREILLARDNFLSTVLHPAVLENVFDDHVRGGKNYRKMIWSLIVLELWHQRFIQRKSVSSLQDFVCRLKFQSRCARAA